MKLAVDRERCEGHAMCVMAAPDLFNLDDEGGLVWAREGSDIPVSAMGEVQSAVDICPVAALRLV